MKKPEHISLIAALTAGLLCTGVAMAQSMTPEQAPNPQKQSQPSQTPQDTPKDQMHPAFDELDKNGDGQLVRSELPESMHDLRAYFHHYDTDDNHHLSRAEYAAYAGPPPTSIM